MNIRQKQNVPEVSDEEIAWLSSSSGDYFDSLPVPLCLINLKGDIVRINNSFSRLIGYDETKLIGKKVNFLFEDRIEAGQLIGKIFSKGVIRGEKANFLTAQREKLFVSLFSSPQKNLKGEAIGYFLAVFNISWLERFKENLESEVKKRTKELENSQKALMNILEDIEEERKKADEEREKTLAIINNFTDGLIVFGKGKKVLLINPRAEGFIGVKENEIIGRPLFRLKKIPIFLLITKILDRKEKKSSPEEFKENENLILEVSVIPIKRGRQKISDLVVLHDVTREKLIEKLKTEFVSLSAHQLRTPLSAIKWTLKMVLDGDLGKINKEEKEFLADAYKSNERMINLVNSLLNVSRIEEGRYIFNLSPLDIGELTKRIVNSYKNEAKEKDISIKIKKKMVLPKIMADKEKMQIVIDNLLKNALKYTPAKGKIIISLETDKKEIKFSIEDNGVGIPADQQKRIFTKFFRASNVKRMDTVGSGLGLYIIKNIIEAHHGKIWFTSQEGKGTTFFFTLPLKIKNIRKK